MTRWNWPKDPTQVRLIDVTEMLAMENEKLQNDNAQLRLTLEHRLAALSETNPVSN